MSGPKALFLAGLSHRSAPIAVRERAALTGEALRDAAAGLVRIEGVAEAMVLSTCHRVEVYVIADTLEPARQFLLARSPEAGGYLYQRSGSEVVRHLFRVTASLDSMVVGEQQILGQVKEAYGICSAVQAAGPIISRLCNKAFAVAKRVRRETGIGTGTSSVSQVAVELVKKIFGDLRGRVILLAGAGKMGALSAKALASLGADGIRVANRSVERAQALAKQVGGIARSWEELDQLLVTADVVLVSTGASTFVIDRDLMAQTMKARKQRSICLIDLAVPRNVDPACGELEDVYAYDIDDLQKVVGQTQRARAEEAIRAEAMVEAEVMAFDREQEIRAALPVLAALRRQAETIARAEAERTLQLIGGRLDAKGRRNVEAMARAIVNKLLHGPTVRLKEAAGSDSSALALAAAKLFGFDRIEGRMGYVEGEGNSESIPADFSDDVDEAEIVILSERKR